MRMMLGGFQGRTETNRSIDRAIGRPGAFARRVLDAEIDRCHAELMRQFLDHALDREIRHRRTRCTIGDGLWPVGDDVVTDGADILQMELGEGAHGAEFRRRAAGEGTTLITEGAVGRRDQSIPGDADLDIDRGAGGWAGCLEDLITAHHHLYRPVGLARQGKRYWFDEDRGFATEATTDFRLRHAQPGNVDAKDTRADIAHHIMALGAAPQFGAAIGRHTGKRRMRLDIALMCRLGLEAALDDDIGPLEAGFDIAMAKFETAGDVGRLLRLRIDAIGEHVVMQHRRRRLHRLVDIGHMRKNFVIDLDQLQRLAGDGSRGGSDRRHGVALIEGLLARHDIAHRVIERRIAIGMIGEVFTGDDRLHARQLHCLGDVDLLDAGMSVRRAQDAPDQLPGRRGIGTEFGAASDLVDTVRAQRTRADDVEFAL